MAAISWDTVEDAIQTWVAVRSGFPADLVRWEYQGGADRELDYIALTISTVTPVGHDYKKYDDSPTFAFTADHTTSKFVGAQGMKTGVGPVRVANVGGVLPAGLDASTNYWAIAAAADGALDIHVSSHRPPPPRYVSKTFMLATSLANALAGTFVAITTDGTGTQKIVPAPGAELRRRAIGTRTAHVTIQAFGQSAMRALVDVMAGLELSIYDLDQAGIGIGTADPVQQVPQSKASGASTLERMAVTGVMIHLASELESRETYIERFQLTATEATIGPVRTFWTPTDPP